MKVRTDRSEKSGSNEQGNQYPQLGCRVEGVAQLQTVPRIAFHLAGVAFISYSSCLCTISPRNIEAEGKDSLAA